MLADVFLRLNQFTVREGHRQAPLYVKAITMAPLYVKAITMAPLYMKAITMAPLYMKAIAMVPCPIVMQMSDFVTPPTFLEIGDTKSYLTRNGGVNL